MSQESAAVSNTANESRLASLETKIDACLVLLAVLTTADGFSCRLDNKSPLWIRAMAEAEALATHVGISLAKYRPEYALEVLSSSYKNHAKRPSGKAVNICQDQSLSEEVQGPMV
jgi:hypothetical protein